MIRPPLPHQGHLLQVAALELDVSVRLVCLMKQILDPNLVTLQSLKSLLGVDSSLVCGEEALLDIRVDSGFLDELGNIAEALSVARVTSNDLVLPHVLLQSPDGDLFVAFDVVGSVHGGSD